MIDRPMLRTSATWTMAAMMVAGCGGARRNESNVDHARESSGENQEIRPENRVSSGSEPVASSAPPSDQTRNANTMDVSGQARDPNVMDVSGGSDLPPRIPSTTQPYSQIVEQAVAPIRVAVAACMAPLGTRAPRMYRLSVELDGQLSPRPPQSVALPAQVASCVERVVRATTVNPAPPIVIAYDLYYLRGP